MQNFIQSTVHGEAYNKGNRTASRFLYIISSLLGYRILQSSEGPKKTKVTQAFYIEYNNRALTNSFSI